MASTSPVKTYLAQIKQNLATGAATEHTHRPALAALFEGAGVGVKVINEPKRIACGAPDLAVLKDGAMVGHVEAKDVGVGLDRAERSEQLKRYREALDNLILTDSLEFRWYVGGEQRRTVRVARWDGQKLKRKRGGAEALADLLSDFLAYAPQPLATPKELAERMARLAHLIREIIVTAFETGEASELLQGWRKAFAEVLVADIDQPEKVGDFADMFAQTLAYGLFSARVMDEGGGQFNRQRAQSLIPRTNPFLRRFFYQITGPDLDDEPYAGFVNDLVQLLAQADMDAILADFGKRTRQEDPTVHFYETFLAAYDPRLREARGVYYTPAPVVSFIVRSVDALLKSRFKLPQGLADTSKVTIKNTDPGLTVRGRNQPRKTTEVHKVLILDPATGTGTFPYAVVDHIRQQFMAQENAGMWSGYGRQHLLPRIFGFELLMAPYAVAHFKLAMQLAGHDLPDAQRQQWVYDFASDERIQVYLTNTLEGPHEHTGLPLFTRFLADETIAANAIKQELPIMVVLGNPPYSGHSANQGEWISNLLRGKLPDGSKTDNYYEVDGQPLGERNPKWLQDDYVKFIRFGQWRIEQSGGGILAFISNNGYLDNPTFRGMRQSLLETFSEIFILDLHGNARKKEVAPDGSPDENVFDIMQGVAIGLFVKEPGKTGPAKVYHADVWGRREEKYRTLFEEDVNSVEWSRPEPQSSFYLFVPQDVDLLSEYQRGVKVSELFPTHSMGVTTGRDSFAVDFSYQNLEKRIRDLSGSIPDSEIRRRYGLKDSSSFSLKTARTWAGNSATSCIERISYRCFDQRYVIYSSSVLARNREEICKHQIERENKALITFRAIRELSWLHVFIAEHPTAKEYISSLDNCYVFFFTGYLDDASNSIFVADMDYLESAETREVDGVYYPEWGEGEFELEFEWEPLMFGIDDGRGAELALFSPNTYGADPENAIYTVDGVYTFIDGESRNAWMYFSDGEYQQVFSFLDDGASGAPREIVPVPGDRFAVLEQWMDMDANGQVSGIATQEGGTVAFGEQMLEWVDLDAAPGLYIIGFIVQDLDGNSYPVYEKVTVQ